MFKTKMVTLSLTAAILATGVAPLAAHADVKEEGTTTASFTVDKGAGRLTLDRAPNMNFNNVQLADLVANTGTTTELKMSSRAAESTVNQLKITDSRKEEGGSWSLNAKMTNFSDNKQTINATNINLGNLTYDGNKQIKTDNPIPQGDQDNVILTNVDANAAAASKAGEIMNLTTDTKLKLGRSSGLSAETDGGFNATVSWTLTDSIL